MKRFLSRLIVLLLCIAAGWVAGYLNIPYVEQYYSFWVGVLATVTFICLFLGILWVWDKRLAGFLRPKFGGKAGSVTGISLVVLLLFALVYQVNKNKALKADELILNKELNEARLVLDSVTSINAAVLLKELFSDIRKELDSSTSRKLSSRTIQKIVNVNQALKPYKRVVSDSMVLITSPERGQLLLFLAYAKIDSSSMSLIKNQVPFAQSYLPNVQLVERNLEGIDLSDSYLYNSNFSKSNLSHSNFSGSVLESSILDSVLAVDVNFQNVNLVSGMLNNSICTGSDFSESQLSRLVAMNTDFSNTKFYLSDFKNATLKKSCFIMAVFARCKLESVNFKSANLSFASMSQSSLEGSVFSSSLVRNDWFELLNKWELKEAISLTNSYKMILDTTAKDSLYRLVEK